MTDKNKYTLLLLVTKHQCFNQDIIPYSKNISHLSFTHLQDLKATDVEQRTIPFAPPKQKGN